MTSSSTGPPLILSPEVFRARFAILRKHYERNGHCRGVKNGRITDFTSMVRSGTIQLAPWQRGALESIEFDFETHRQKAEWLATFYMLSHLLRMGHTIDDKMKQWIHTQKLRHLHNKLSKDRVALLNNIHFDSIPHMLQDVVEEPRNSSDNTGIFLGTTPCHSGSPTGATTSLPAQSPFGAAHVIPREKRTAWDSYFQALRTNIAADLVDADLRTWIREQQVNYHSLTEYRRERLKEIGLGSSDHEDKLQRKRTKGMNQRTLYWDDMWEDLKACRDHHGNDWLSTVPEELGKWLRRQRLLLDSDQLSDARQAKLASIGIVPIYEEGVSALATKKSHDPLTMTAPHQGIRRVSLY